MNKATLNLHKTGISYDQRPIITEFRGDYSFLSNFFPAPITYDGFRYANNEAAFQAQKTTCMKERLQFSRLASPAEAKALGRRVCLRSDWNEIKIQCIYHGSNIAFDKIDRSKSHNRRDFGRGFYCTLLESQAKEWAHRLYIRNFFGGEYVYQYIFHPTDKLNMKRFTALDEEWLEFVKENRVKGGQQHPYDVVIGPVADDNTMETIQLYISGILKSDEAVERLRYNKVNNQVSFHTPQALNHLTFEVCKEVQHD